ncbi:MAG: queuosine precursor transporter [Phycisphaerales bacterium]
MAADNTPELMPERLAAQTAMTNAQWVYLVLSAIFISSLLIADIIGVRLFKLNIFGWNVEHTCGMLTFPVTFLLTDLVNEYFGQKAARRLVWLGLAMGMFVFIVVNVSLAMPHLDKPYNVSEDAYGSIFANSRIMYIASLSAYLVGSFSDILIFAWIKRLTGGKMVWLRATGSTIISQVIDSFVVTWLAFSVGRHLFPSAGAEPMTMPDVLRTAATGYTLKFVLAIGITPLIYLGRYIIRTRYGLVPLPASKA